MEKIEYPILDKKYKLLSKLGSGATSEVYLGENLETKEKIAIKILKLDTKPFEQETETLSLLHHKNILNLISKGEGAIEKEQNKSPNYKYIILEYAEKGELFNYVYFPQSGFGEKIGKYIFKEILTGLNHCHENNIAHRDLKMENIILDKDFTIKLADFGYATSLKGKNGDGKLTTPLGTRAYASPEIFLKKPYNGISSDIFSLGVVLFTLVTCKMPFGQAVRSDKYYRFIIVNQYDKYWERLKAAGNEVDSLSNEFKKLFISMIKFNPNERPSINDILNCDWMKGDCANNLEVLSDFAAREITVKQQLELEKIANENVSYDNKVYRSSGDYEVFFNDDITIKKFDNCFNCFRDVVIVNGNFNCVDFMNMYASKIKKEQKGDSQIIPSNKNLKFRILYDDENNDNSDDENNEKLKKFDDKVKFEENYHINEDYEEDDNIEFEECIIDVKLKKFSDKDGFVIIFNKASGDRKIYYDKVNELKEIIQKLI